MEAGGKNRQGLVNPLRVIELNETKQEKKIEEKKKKKKNRKVVELSSTSSVISERNLRFYILGQVRFAFDLGTFIYFASSFLSSQIKYRNRKISTMFNYI